MEIFSGIPTRAHTDLFRLVNGAPVQAARVTLAAGRVSITGEPVLVAELKAGIVDPMTGDELTDADGWAFLAALSGVYKNPFLYATDVISDE